MNLLANEFLAVELGKLGFRGALLSSWNLSWRRALAAVVEPSVSLPTFLGLSKQCCCILLYGNTTDKPKADHQCRLSERDQAMSRLITKTWANFVKLVDVYISINVNRLSLLI